MFDMGFTEMMLIGIVAPVVIGPERLPGVARTAGKYFARLRNFMMDVRAENRSVYKIHEDLSTGLTPLSREKTINRGALRILCLFLL